MQLQAKLRASKRRPKKAAAGRAPSPHSQAHRAKAADPSVNVNALLDARFLPKTRGPSEHLLDMAAHANRSDMVRLELHPLLHGYH